MNYIYLDLKSSDQIKFLWIMTKKHRRLAQLANEKIRLKLVKPFGRYRAADRNCHTKPKWFDRECYTKRKILNKISFKKIQNSEKYFFILFSKTFCVNPSVSSQCTNTRRKWMGLQNVRKCGTQRLSGITLGLLHHCYKGWVNNQSVKFSS